jgi:CRISPR-associated protein Csd1
VLGINKENGDALTVEGGRLENHAKSHLHFWKQVDDAYETTKNPVIEALLRFKNRYLPIRDEKVSSVLPFVEIRRNKRGEPEVGGKTNAGDWVRFEMVTITFQVEGRIVFNGADSTDTLTEYWREAFGEGAFAAEMNDAEVPTATSKGVCMVTGEPDVPIARSHKPKLLGVPGIGSGGYIVSFAKECPAFSSYGFEMGRNAPMSEKVAASYALALQSLLDNDSSSLKIGSAVACFWAKNDFAACDFFAQMLNRPDPQAVADFLKSPWAGVDRHLASGDQFYSVTLTGNSGRVVVRHWIQQTVAAARDNLKRWFDDLNIRPSRSVVAEAKRKTKQDEKEGTPPLAVFRLACATVRDAKDIPAVVSEQLYRAALEGSAPSLALLQPVLAEFQSALVSDSREKPRYPYNESRFALLKLILNRNRKESDPMMEPVVCETNDPAYNCGRLLAVFDELQEAAHDHKLEGPGVVERYYGTASSAPNSAFGILWRLHQHHLRKLRRSDGARQAAARAIEDRIADVARLFRQPAANLPPQFPRTFTLVEQGRFALGFYQEKAASRIVETRQ